MAVQVLPLTTNTTLIKIGNNAEKACINQPWIKLCCTGLTVRYRPVASFLPLSSAGAGAEFSNVLRALRTAPPRRHRQEQPRRAAGSAAKPRRATPVHHMPERFLYRCRR